MNEGKMMSESKEQLSDNVDEVLKRTKDNAELYERLLDAIIKDNPEFIKNQDEVDQEEKYFYFKGYIDCVKLLKDLGAI